MVQLKLTTAVAKSLLALRFNSCMVQLKLNSPDTPLFSKGVLIPVWCNWNQRITWRIFLTLAGFNSCMVQLKSYSLKNFLEQKPGFNSCMVQLKSLDILRFQSYTDVLIPVWCNWNNERLRDKHRERSFNSCMVQLKWWRLSSRRSHSGVLIPVWCNWNLATPQSPRKRCRVLIPVWCNWNSQVRRRRAVRAACFNSCMVQLKFDTLHRGGRSS